jgi:hypothetical protein
VQLYISMQVGSDAGRTYFQGLHSMPRATDEAEAEVAVNFLDVVQIPTIGVLVLQHVGYEGCRRSRVACRALCMLVRG